MMNGKLATNGTKVALPPKVNGQSSQTTTSNENSADMFDLGISFFGIAVGPPKMS
jgi:hypothetical protein